MYREEKRKRYIEKLRNLSEENPVILLVSIDNVGANLISSIRMALRGKAEFVVGKNSLLKRALFEVGRTDMKIRELKKLVSGNVGLIFTKEDPKEIREILNSYIEFCEAKKGVIAPSDFVIERGNTMLEPTKTVIFQKAMISTRIMRGQVEVIKSRKVITKGEIVGEEIYNLLNVMNMKPFQYRVEIVKVYDHGEIYDSNVLDITDNDLTRMFGNVVRNVQAVSMSLDSMNSTSISGIFSEAFRNVLSVPIATNYEFPESQEVKKFVKKKE